MRSIIIIGLALVSIVALSYQLFENDTSSNSVSAASNLTVASIAIPGNLTMQQKLNKLVIDLEKYYTISNKQMQQTQARQADLSEEIVSLTKRVEQLNMNRDVNSERVSSSKLTEGPEQRATDDNIELSQNPGQSAKNDLSQWIDQEIDFGNIDANLSALATEQVSLSLVETDNVELNDLKCGEQVCRATFSYQPGEATVIQELIGKPPFVTEGFTVEEGDGRVSFYFTQPGISMSELQLAQQQ